MSCTIPESTDILQGSKFLVVFSRLPHLQYFCQEVNLPGLSTTPAKQENPFVDFPIAPDKSVYTSLDFTFLVDNKMETWKEVHDWIRGMTFITDFREYKNLNRLSPMVSEAERPQYCDCTLSVLSGLNTPLMRFKFYDVFPHSLSPIQFSTKYSAEHQVTCSTSFRFKWFEMEKI